MKKFKVAKTIKSLEVTKLTKDQMNQATGGLKKKFGCSCSWSVCDICDGNEPD